MQPHIKYAQSENIAWITCYIANVLNPQLLLLTAKLSMPGPCNGKKKRRLQSKKFKKNLPISNSPDNEKDQHSSAQTVEMDDPQHSVSQDRCASVRTVERDTFMLQTPYIHDPGNGPRVRNTRAFLSSFFAQPPSLEDPLCAEFAQEEVLQMLSTVLPEEMALVNLVTRTLVWQISRTHYCRCYGIIKAE